MSVSIEDVTPKNPEEFRKLKIERFNKAEMLVKSLPPLRKNSTELELIEQENKIKGYVDEAKKELLDKFFKDFVKKDSSLSIFIKSKAKGNPTQISYASAFLGQQLIECQFVGLNH